LPRFLQFLIVVAKEGINKLPSLDFSEEDVTKIANKIVEDFLSKFVEQTPKS